MSDIPQPRAPRPWTRQSGKPPIYDRNLKPVSFIEEAEFLFHIEQCHDDLIAALKEARSAILLGRRRPQKVIDQIGRALAKAGAA